MFVIYDEIRLDPAQNGVEVCDADWTINPKHHYMEHEPTRTVFQIDVDEKATESEPLTMMDFSARLVAIRPGYALPGPEMIETLGRAALALYLVAFGYAARQEQSKTNLPDGMQQGYAC